MRFSWFLHNLQNLLNPKDLNCYEDIEAWLQAHKVEHYHIHLDFSVSVDSGVMLSAQGIAYLPFKFKTVSGDFNCSHNELTSLRNAPDIVGGYFDCSHNQLTSLQGGPHTVGHSLNVSHNPLQSLEHAPILIGECGVEHVSAHMRGIAQSCECEAIDKLDPSCPVLAEHQIKNVARKFH